MESEDPAHPNGEDPAHRKSTSVKQYSIELSKDLAQRLDRHIQMLKNLDVKNKFKQTWVQEAIQEKLEREKKFSFEGLESEYLHFKLSDQMHKKVKDQVSLIKKFKQSYSQKKWFVEAFYEKLDREEPEVNRLIQNIIESEDEDSTSPS